MPKNHKHHQYDPMVLYNIYFDFTDDGIPEEDIHVLSVEDTLYFRESWKQVYIQPYIHNAQIDPTDTFHNCPSCRGYSTKNYNSYNWHVFSGNLTPHRTVDTTFLCHFAIEEPSFLYMFEDCGLPVIRFSSKYAEIFADDNRDFYLFPDTCRWTYVSTHEQPWIGPFYSDIDILREAKDTGKRMSPKKGKR